MNKQETFDVVVRHLLTQNERSRVEGVGGSCVYRGPKGLKCAIGALISDNLLLLVPANSAPVTSLPDAVLEHILPEDMDRVDGLNFLSTLQGVHDCYGPCDWKEELYLFAQDYDLSTDILEPSNIEDLVNELELDKCQEEMVPA